MCGKRHKLQRTLRLTTSPRSFADDDDDDSSSKRVVGAPEKKSDEIQAQGGLLIMLTQCSRRQYEAKLSAFLGGELF